MSFVVGVDYYAISEEDYDFLVELMTADFMNDQHFQPYKQGGKTYYLTLTSEISQEEASDFANNGYSTALFGIARFTNSVQANITFPE